MSLPAVLRLRLLLLLISLISILTPHVTRGQDCAARFEDGRRGFVVDTETSVGRGAALIASPPVATVADCVEACCELPSQCNVVLVEEEDDDDSSTTTCSLFNCVYKQEFVCRFVSKQRFSSFVLKSVYQRYLEAPEIAGLSAGPVAVPGRDVVVRPGQKVTLRGVESRAPTDATITGYTWSLLTGDPSVVMEATADQVEVSNLTPGTYVFQLQVTDSKGQSDTAKVNILVLNQEESDMYCLAPQEVGLCRASFPRWFYDTAAGRCREFIYGGCKGNRNKFLSEKECSAACANVKAPTTRSVALPATEEDCTAQCVKGQFTCGSGCCVDRSQECDGTRQCSDASDESACSQLNKTFSGLMEVNFDDNLARCTEPPKAGPCRDNRSVWYYNPLQRECHPFTFSGCHGNGNNFASKETCEQTCTGVTEKSVFAPGMFAELEETESGSIAIAIVLAVSILVLLAVLSFFFLKGKRKRAHQPVATTPPPPGDGSHGDTVVYRSTTKPI